MKKELTAFILIALVAILGCEKKAPEIIEPNDFTRPFAINSIWNRQIPINSRYVDVYDAIWGDPVQAPNRVRAELVTLSYVDESQPEVKFFKSIGWDFPERSEKRGDVLYTRRLAFLSGTETRYPNTGNASFVIIDAKKGTSVEGSAGWRVPGEDFITFFDEPRLHDIDLNGAGLKGTLGSGLPALGGLLRLGEINSTINHSLAISLSSLRFSIDVHYLSPASQGDGFASDPVYGYLGSNKNYTMGTLLAIPSTIDIDSISWNTAQGYNLAIANQKYGWYIIDSSTGGIGGDLMKISIERNAAFEDLGLTVDKSNNEITVDPNKIDFDGFESDVKTILQHVMATTK